MKDVEVVLQGCIELVAHAWSFLFSKTFASELTLFHQQQCMGLHTIHSNVDFSSFVDIDDQDRLSTEKKNSCCRLAI